MLNGRWRAYTRAAVVRCPGTSPPAGRRPRTCDHERSGRTAGAGRAGRQPQAERCDQRSGGMLPARGKTSAGRVTLRATCPCVGRGHPSRHVTAPEGVRSRLAADFPPCPRTGRGMAHGSACSSGSGHTRHSCRTDFPQIFHIARVISKRSHRLRGLSCGLCWGVADCPVESDEPVRPWRACRIRGDNGERERTRPCSSATELARSRTPGACSRPATEPSGTRAARSAVTVPRPGSACAVRVNPAGRQPSWRRCVRWATAARTRGGRGCGRQDSCDMTCSFACSVQSGAGVAPGPHRTRVHRQVRRSVTACGFPPGVNCGRSPGRWWRVRRSAAPRPPAAPVRAPLPNVPAVRRSRSPTPRGRRP